MTYFGSIFQQYFSLDLQKTFLWLLLTIYTSSVTFFSPLLKSFNCKKQKLELSHNIHNFHWNSWHRNLTYLRVFRGFLEISCPMISKRQNKQIYFHDPQLSHSNYDPIIFSWYFQLESEDELTIVQMPTISGDKWL